MVPEPYVIFIYDPKLFRVLNKPLLLIKRVHIFIENPDLHSQIKPIPFITHVKELQDPEEVHQPSRFISPNASNPFYSSSYSSSPISLHPFSAPQPPHQRNPPQTSARSTFAYLLMKSPNIFNFFLLFYY